MEFKEAIKIISDVLSTIGTPIDEDAYDGILVKKMESSNTLDEGRTTNQTHIAITGAQMDIFPYIRAEGYFAEDSDSELKKYFIPQIPVCIRKANCVYLNGDTEEGLPFGGEVIEGKTSVVRSRRKNQADQIQVSLINFDSKEFVAFRKLLHTGSYMILLKRKKTLKYDIFGVIPNKGIKDDGGLQSINNLFFKLPTNTIVDVDLQDEDALSRNFYGMHITKRNSAVANGEINIGWSDLGDLAAVESKDQLSALMDSTYPDKKPRSKSQDISQIWTFKDGMSVGDYVVFSDGVNAHIGIIKSEYYYEVDSEARDEDYVNNHKVEWLKTISREDLPKVFRSALSSARSVFSLNAYKSIILELLEKGTVDIDDDETEDIEEETMEAVKPYIELNFTTNIECDFERNRIVFGAPGTGKSFQMEEDRAALVKMGGDYERVTFHPDYTYSSFVGCYKPVSEQGKIEYKYVPGPFMRVLVEALRSGLTDNPKPYLLVIEEINRAKVAAVFGEVFQLLDRDSNGTSDYEIHTSEDVRKYLSDELNGSLESFSRIRIPNNMFIWATMNSADQGVFPMDTAFKRRWSFEYKGIDENEDKVGGLITLGEGEHEFEVNWNVLRKAINEVLAKKFNINEDKLMGPFFISEDVFAFDENGRMKNPAKFKRVFKSKVIMYLYEDAAKQQKHKLFAGCDSTKYSSICDAFDKIGIEIFGADFKDTYKDME